MKTFFKVFAITTEILIWLIVGGLAGWHSGGGVLIWMLMFASITATLRFIEKKVPSCSSSHLKEKSEDDEEEEEEDLSYFDENKSEEEEEDLSYFDNLNNSKSLSNIETNILTHISNLSINTALMFKNYFELDKKQILYIEIEIYFYLISLFYTIEASKKVEKHRKAVSTFMFDAIPMFATKANEKQINISGSEIQPISKDRMLNYLSLWEKSDSSKYSQKLINYQIELVSYIIKYSKPNFYNLFPKSIREYSESETDMLKRMNIKIILEETIYKQNIEVLIKLINKY